MRLLIYLLAMLTGFSAAEAARPVSAVPAAVGTTLAQKSAAVAVRLVEHRYVRPELNAQFSVMPADDALAFAILPAIKPTTPVLRHDVILG